MSEKRWIDQEEIMCQESQIGRASAGMMTVYVKKFEILEKERANSTALSDCVPIIMDLVTCDLNVDGGLRESLLRSLVQMVVSSERVVQRLSVVACQTDVLMRNLLREMRDHVMTQYKHYQLYTHNMVTVMKCLARLVKNNKGKQKEIMKTTYWIGEDRCTLLDVILKPTQYLVSMNKIFNNLEFKLLDTEDMNYATEIKRYLTQVFNKIQSKIDLISDVVDEIVKWYEVRRQKKSLIVEKWKKIKEILKEIFNTTIVLPCLFILGLYLKYYFPTDEQVNEYLNTIME